MKAAIIGMPRPCDDAPPIAAMNSTCVPVSAPMPWIMPTPNAVRTPYEDISIGSTCSCPWSCDWNRRQAYLKESKTILQHCARINQLEKEGDRLYREAVARIFDSGRDPIFVIKAKEIIETLEAANGKTALTLAHSKQPDLILLNVMLPNIDG